MAKKSGNVIILNDLHNSLLSSSSKESNITEIQKVVDKLNEKPDKCTCIASLKYSYPLVGTYI